LADAYRWGRTFEPVDDEPVVVFIDPPYGHFERQPAKANRLLDDLVRKLVAGSVLAVESRRMLDGSVLPDFAAWEVRRYGGTQLAFRFLSGTPENPPATPLQPVGITE
jgi:16S rRNA G966 N2-methylase RsmD